jgi:hypothetical protein
LPPSAWYSPVGLPAKARKPHSGAVRPAGDYYARRQHHPLLDGASRRGISLYQCNLNPKSQQACPLLGRPVFLQAVSILKGLFVWLRVILYEDACTRSHTPWPSYLRGRFAAHKKNPEI